jgi:hypothetical protein
MCMSHDTDVALHVVENRSARQIGRGMFLSGRPAKVCRVNQYQIFAGLSAGAVSSIAFTVASGTYGILRYRRSHGQPSVPVPRIQDPPDDASHGAA